ncbi:MAG: hypothetical protein A2Z88_01290 [Omnitrophica WOR_2 bacterium GWA2_47_8]|nr:MAG: hypothetical protein A2Z88_01290 [Omnitrophica WOR_2 bacterium GWA2_47_8]
MPEFFWDELKNKRLKLTRGVSFDKLVTARFVNLIDHPTREGQLIMLYEYQNYIWAIPCIKIEKGLFLKTLYPSRKYTKIYLGGNL